jgi:lipoprotein NlpI
MSAFLIALFAAGCFAQTPQVLYQQAVAEFRAGRVAESARIFDRLARTVPQQAPELWQRGIALYYAGRYADCRAQFESHRAVNPDDVENAAWHFLCVARQESFSRARAALLPVGPDSRRPMREILDLFRGRRNPEEVLRAAGDAPDALFYAHLYTGLFAEAAGDADQARKHIRIAAEERFSFAGYMYMVAQVHRDLLDKR